MDDVSRGTPKSYGKLQLEVPPSIVIPQPPTTALATPWSKNGSVPVGSPRRSCCCRGDAADRLGGNRLGGSGMGIAHLNHSSIQVMNDHSIWTPMVFFGSRNVKNLRILQRFFKKDPKELQLFLLKVSMVISIFEV